jgi:hypothetical protein
MRFLLLGCFLSSSLITGFGCQEDAEHKLRGSWQAVELLEEGDPLPIDVKQIGITFHEEGAYEYHSTLNYQEAGYYYLNGKILYRLDTLNQASTEKAVEIAHIESDSLVFRMNENGRERLLILERAD